MWRTKGLVITCTLILSPLTQITTTIAARNGPAASQSYAHNAVDPYVSMSPLIVAAVGSDGIALLTLHVTHTLEPLLLSEEDETEDSVEGDDGGDRDRDGPTHVHSSTLKDLPLDSKGPLRIHVLDEVGSSLLLCGWKTDGMVLLDQARSIARKERNLYGKWPTPNQGSGKSGVSAGGDEYGRFVAHRCVSFLAKCAAGESVRSLQCAALLATAGGDLWLMDATGAYACRAHALGAGSNIVNKHLSTCDFGERTARECAHILLKTVKDYLMDPKEGKEEDEYRIPSGSRVEMAVLEFESQRLKRLRQPF